MKIKTIDVNAREWFDKVNGNSYFSGNVTLNFGMKSQKSFDMPFQYGYGSHYIDMASNLLSKEGMVKPNGESFWRYCKDNKIILRTSKQENCKKREL